LPLPLPLASAPCFRFFVSAFASNFAWPLPLLVPAFLFSSFAAGGGSASAFASASVFAFVFAFGFASASVCSRHSPSVFFVVILRRRRRICFCICSLLLPSLLPLLLFSSVFRFSFFFIPPQAPSQTKPGGSHPYPDSGPNEDRISNQLATTFSPSSHHDFSTFFPSHFRSDSRAISPDNHRKP
jgi:hypothetical protein